MMAEGLSTVGPGVVTREAFQQLRPQQTRQGADRAEPVARDPQRAAAGSPQLGTTDRAQEPMPRSSESMSRGSESRPAGQVSETMRPSQPQAPQTSEQSQRSEAPRIFVNAQGQKTGTIISVTA